MREYEKTFTKLKFTSVPKMPKDIFKINKVSDNTLLDLQFVLSSHESRVKLIEILCSHLQGQYKPGFVFQGLVEK